MRPEVAAHSDRGRGRSASGHGASCAGQPNTEATTLRAGLAVMSRTLGAG